jgi:hypothetical protein
MPPTQVEVKRFVAHTGTGRECGVETAVALLGFTEQIQATAQAKLVEHPLRPKTQVQGLSIGSLNVTIDGTFF